MSQSASSSGQPLDENIFDGLLDSEAESPPIPLEKQLVERLKVMREQKDQISLFKSNIKELEESLEEAENEVLKMMEALNLQNMRVADVGTVYLATSVYPKVHDMSRFIEWLDNQGEGSIAKRTVNAATLKSWYRDRVASGEDLPNEEVIDHHLRKEVRFKK